MTRLHSPTSLRIAALAVLALAPARAAAQSGVSDERVSLPDGPGSIGGVGDNVDVDANMGAMSTTIAIELPQGLPTATPSIALQYASGSGSGEVGYGWSLPIPSIERMRMRGLPLYDDTDEIVANGGSELVRVGIDGTRAVYRARYEGGFVRYRWHDRMGGAAGYWTAEQPDGSVMYFGADPSGVAVRTARVQTPAGQVYRWHLSAVVDRFGNVTRYTYVKDGEHSLISEIGYAYPSPTSAPRFAVRFEHETRPDPITTGEPGFLLALRQRLREIQVRSGSETIRRYLLTYEAPATSGGASRLAMVDQRGRGDATSPIQFTFEYSRSLDGSCSGSCAGPFMVDMGTLPAGIDLRNGRATLIDMNGDALPDVVDTGMTGRHTIVPNRLDAATGTPSFDASYPSAATPSAGSPFQLTSPGVQVIDVNGDGFTDIISSRTGQVLCNDGSGDWNGTACLMNSTLPVLDSDGVGDPNPLHVRFLDYDDDHRIDMIRTLVGSTEVFVNTGADFVQRAVDDIGAVFDDSPTLQLSDLNGDGLQDPVEILPGGAQLRYRLNLGYGRWTPWTTVSISGFGAGDLDLIELEDLNGDGLADVVLVAGNTLTYAINRGDSFDPATVVTSADVEGDIPERLADVTVVLFADMNGSGSRDVVWITSGRVRFLELFPTRPNLISRVENGIGSVQEIEYGSSVVQQARDRGTADEWTEHLPYAVNVVVGLDVWNRLTGDEDGVGLHDTTEMIYHQGYYDGVERAFRGFAYVERLDVSDMATDGEEGSRSVLEYDVGATDPYRAGRLLRDASFAGQPGAWRPIQESLDTHEDCPVDGVPTTGLTRPVRYVCQTAHVEIEQEGAPPAEWITTRTETEHDGYGQATRTSALGVVHRGPPSAPTGCAPCGATASGACGDACTGDEQITEIEYISPGTATSGAWILGSPVRSTTHDGTPGGPRSEMVARYDGPDFVGLPEGQLTRGAVTSTRTRTSGDTWIDGARYRRDAFGNVVEEILPRGSVSVTDEHRRILVFEADGLRPIREEVLFHDGEGRPARLRRDTLYETSFLEPSEQTAWMLVRDGTVLTERNSARSRYDAFGRPSALLEPGDVDATPSQEYVYELGSPVSRIIVRARSQIGGAQNTEEIQCFDGLGRRVQTRTRVGPGDYQVSQYLELNRRGNPVRIYQAYRSPSAACDTTPPSSRYVQYVYDSQGRASVVTYPDDDVYGDRSETHYEYAPLRTTMLDAEDTQASSDHAGTATTRRYDGLGRLVQIDRDLGGGEIGVTRLRYDGLGRLVSVVDPIGEEHEQAYDLAGRVISVTDPSTGTVTFTYDAAGNPLERRDARGRRLAIEYDALGRTIAQFDPDDEAATRTSMTYDLDDSCDECANGAGRLVSATFPMGSLGTGRDELGYDARGRNTFLGRTFEGYRYEIRHEFDGFGRLMRSTMPGGVVIDRSYDDAARPIAIGGAVSDVAYDERGNIATLFYENGVETQRAFDGATRLTTLEHRSGAAVLQGSAYTRDRVGNILAIEDTSEAEAGDPGLAATFEYDAWYRLVHAAFGAAGSEETLDVEYDLGDRVLRRESSLGEASRAHAGVLEYDEDHPDRVVRAGERTYAYDAAGNMTSRDGTTYTWDHFGRMTESEGEAHRGEFLYSTGPDRVAKLEDGGATFYLTPETEVRDGVVYVYPRLLQWRLARIRSTAIQTQVLSDVAPLSAGDDEINAADAWISHASSAGIVSGPADASDPMRLLRGAARRLLAEDGGDVAYLHHDHLGSITLATDADGAQIGETHYYPHGEIRHRTGFTDEHGFSGQELDASTDLISYRFRQLDPEIGRWASADPGFGSLTTSAVDANASEATAIYSYVGNHVINALDEEGLEGTRMGSSPRRAATRAIGSALGRGLRAVGRWMMRNKAATVVLAAGVVAAALLTGGVGLAALGAAGIAAACAVGGIMIGKGIRVAFTRWQRNRAPLSPRTRSILRNVGRAIFVGGAIMTAVALAVGITVVTGGAAAVAGVVGVGVWAAVEAMATSTAAEIAVGAADVVGSLATERVEASDEQAAQLERVEAQRLEGLRQEQVQARQAAEQMRLHRPDLWHPAARPNPDRQ